MPHNMKLKSLQISLYFLTQLFQSEIQKKKETTNISSLSWKSSIMSIASDACVYNSDIFLLTSSSDTKQMIEEQSTATLLDESKTKMAMPKRKITKILKMLAVISVIAVIIFVIIALSTGRRVSEIMKIVTPVIADSSSFEGIVDVNAGSRTITFTDRDLKQKYLNIIFPHVLADVQYKPASPCRDSFSSWESESQDSDLRDTVDNAPQICMQFENDLHAAIYEIDVDGILCHSVQWYSQKQNTEISNCISIGNDRWYGGGGLSEHRWPLNRVNVPPQPYVTQKFKPVKAHGDPLVSKAAFDSFIEPYFVSAKGASIMLEPYLPLFVSMNSNGDQKLCFTSAYRKPYIAEDEKDLLLLKYTVCKERTAKAMHRNLLTNTLPHPFESPSLDMLRTPIWSTRGLDVADINEQKLLPLVKGMKVNKLPYSQLFIDGNYSRNPGSIYFNEKKFPHSHQLIMELASDPNDEKLHVGTEVFPHVSDPDSKTFAIHYKKNMTTVSNPNPPLFLDVTNKEAVSWYDSQLTDLSKQIGLKGFRFSGGHALSIVEGQDQSALITVESLHNPNVYTTKYAEIATNHSNRSLLGSGYKSQKLTYIADSGPMMSTWTHTKGLKSIIPTVITYGIMGYPFVLAGPIGGVTDSINKTSQQLNFPDKELYIRWLQLATYLPVMEFSVGPWEYGEKVLNYTRSMLEFRRDVLWPKYFSAAVAEATAVGTPIARPLWWIAPGDETAEFIDCEFVLSNTLLVAPVLFGDARYRDVYLPEGGYWKDQLRGKYYQGGQWLRRFEVGLYEIATFIREAPPKTPGLREQDNSK